MSVLLAPPREHTYACWVSDDVVNETPQAVRELAEACVRFVERAVGIALDYTPDTLPILDHYLQEARDVGHEEVVDLVAPSAGAYFGEVVRRQLGAGRWHLEEAYEGWRIEFETFFLTFNPIGAALEAIRGEAVEGHAAHLAVLPEDQRAVKESLARTGDVRSEDFYRLAIRFEAIEQVADLLAELSARKKEGSRNFGPEVYAAFRERGANTLH